MAGAGFPGPAARAETRGTIYQAALRAESEARLGLVWGPVDRNGQADIIGVPDGLVTHYSKRR